MKNYAETIQYLYDLQYSGIKLGLDNISRLLDFWNNPQDKWKAIHIAGTNGKGSTAAFIYSALREAGYRVGLYTSPHLIDFTERIRVNGQSISWQTVVDYTDELKPVIETVRPTFFEATSAIAFSYFAEQEVDIAVIETGLGGRLDATNVVNPLISVITPVSLDHTQYLGETLEQVAREKAGIVKTGIPCVTNNEHPEAVHVLKEKCQEVQAPFYLLNRNRTIQPLETTLRGSTFNFSLDGMGTLGELSIPLSGAHQVSNAALAAASLLLLPEISISVETIRTGFARTRWHGRLEIVEENPLTILDVAHNPDGFRQVFHFLEQQVPEKRIWVLAGLAKDKDYQTIAGILSTHAFKIGLIRQFSQRGLPAGILRKALAVRGVEAIEFESIEKGVCNFHHLMESNDLMLIIGSHFLAEKFYKNYKNVDLIRMIE
ncbi:MAG TPA: bifunctional folylpolyglutamate synthase/dihydrofolate synthase [Caldithrix sp.]|nr:bifunctional folylpolyglutamate synthase/dihydrofolate synthase [Caldithrix sp.]